MTWTASAVVVALGAVWGVAWASDDDSADEVDCGAFEVATLEMAVKWAEHCQHDVAALETYDPWSRAVATPAGPIRQEMSMSAVRTDVSGDWVEPDPTVVVDERTGELSVAAPVYDVKFDSDGGDGTSFVRVSADGGSVAFDAPTALGAPSVDGARVSWPMLDGSGAAIDGVLLSVHVLEDASGATPVIEVRDPGAYAALSATAGDAPVGFTVTSSGSLEFDQPDGAAGGFAVVDAETDEQLFAGSVPVQWDSAGGAATGSRAAPSPAAQGVLPDDARPVPSAGDEVAVMDLRVSDEQTVVVSASDDMVADSATQWPVVLDPTLTGSRNLTLAVRSYAGWQSIEGSTASNGEGVGRCDDVTECQRVHSARLYWKFVGLDAIKTLGDPDDVVSAKFEAFGTHAAYCTATALDLHLMAAHITTATVWSNQPSSKINLDSQSPKLREGCGAPGFVTWDATRAIRDIAGTASQVTLGLRSPTEDSMPTWHRFRMNDATLTVLYNLQPSAPALGEMSMANDKGIEATTCVAGTRAPIPTSVPTLSAIGRDPDGDKVAARFEVHQNGQMVWGQTLSTLREGGALQSAKVASGAIDRNLAAMWRARVTDSNGRTSPWSDWCQFSVDVVAPGAPVVTPIPPEGPDSVIQAVYETGGVERGGAGVTGCWRFSPGNPDDVVRYRYSIVDESRNGGRVADASGNATKCWAPDGTGPKTLYVSAVDAAGNDSGVTSYRFVVAEAIEDAIWTFDARSNPTRDVSVQDTGSARQPGDMIVRGATWATGPQTLFDAREDDTGLLFAGGDDEDVYSRSRVIDTSANFVVSAHVRLDKADRPRTAIAQEGSTTNRWTIGYQSTGCPDGLNGCWVFGLRQKDGAAAKVVYSRVKPVQGEWAMLLAEYDKQATKMRLWVCSIGTPDSPHRAEPLRAEGPAPSLVEAAPGQLVVGRGQLNGAATARWVGAVDNIRVFKGEVLAPAKIRRVCQGAEANAVLPAVEYEPSAVQRQLDDLDPTKDS